MPYGDKKKHESYGLIQFNRVTSSKEQPLFGSSIQHNNTIRLEVKPASVERSLNRDWYFENGTPYVIAEMSYSQFAEAITSMNNGVGTPITLRYLNGKKVEEPDLENKRLQFENEMQERMNVINSKLEHLTKNTEDILNNKKTINKSDKEIILKEIAMLRQEVKSNIPFVLTSFNEQMDKTVTEAKGEIEAFTQNKIHSLGLEKLEDLKRLNQEENRKLIE
jgi:hypothetical protein